MKNRDVVNILGFMIILLVIVVMYFFRYKSNLISDNVMNKTWYRYDYTTGYYEKIIFNKNSVNYYKPVKGNETTEYDGCKKYNYNKKNTEFSLDCGLKIKYLNYNDDRLLLKINNNDRAFYLNVEDSLNHEFEAYFGKTIYEYKKEKMQAKDFIKINEAKLFEIIKNNEYSKIVFIGNKCSSIDCTLVLDVMEKWISTTENVYYFDINDMNDKVIKKLNEIDKSLGLTIDYYDNIYPKVIISNNNKIVDKYDVICSGFNCKKYYSNEF